MSDHQDAPLVKAFLSLYEELKSFVVRKYGCRVLAEEVVQETWFRVRGHSPAQEITAPRPYLFRMVSNLAIDHLRSQNRRARHVIHDDEASEDIRSHAPQADKVIDYRQRLLILRKAVDALPPRRREVFLLHKFEGLRHAEIAARLGISKNMVEKHIMRGLAHCRESLKKALR